MTLLSSAKPPHLSPQEPADPNRLPSTHEEARAGPRGVQPEPGSREHLRRARISQMDSTRGGRAGSPSPSILSSTPTLLHNSSSLETSTTLSSSSSVRTPSPAYSICNSFTNGNHSGFTPCTPDQPADSAPPSPSAPVRLLLEERAAALSKDLWKADADAESCDRPGCETKFGFWKERKHHCRKCGLVFCKACSSASHPLLFPLNIASTTTPSTPLSQSPPSLAHPTTSSHVLPSRVCLDCKHALSSPVPERRPVSRRSSFTHTLTPSGDDDDDPPSGASATADPAFRNHPSPSLLSLTNRSLSSRNPNLSLSLSSLSAQQTHQTASPFRSPLASPNLPREPWMDGPLGEFPLAYPRNDKVVDRRLHSLAKVDGLGRKRSLQKSYFPSSEEQGEEERVDGWRRSVELDRGMQRTSPSSEGTRPEDKTAAANWSSYST